MSDHVKLGQHNLPVYPQTPNRIIRRLGKVVDKVRNGGAISSEGVDPTLLVASLGDDIYYVFETFIPSISDHYPKYEFMGFPNRDAYDAQSYDEDADAVSGDHKSLAPTFPQYLDAFDVLIELNGGRRFLEALGKVLDLSAMKAQFTLGAMDLMDQASPGSPSLPGTSGTSQQTTSGLSDQTSQDQTEDPQTV